MCESKQSIFQGKLYELLEAEVSYSMASFQYVPYDRSNNVIFVERYNLPAEQIDHFIQDWYAKEMAYRKNDCVLQYKVARNVPYATCDFKNGTRYVIYLLDVKDNRGFARAYISAQKQSDTKEKEIVNDLAKFYP